MTIAKVRIDGLSPLICHHFPEKIRKMLLDKATRKTAKAREDKDPEAEFNAARYRIDENGFEIEGVTGLHPTYADGLPVRYIKEAMVQAARDVEGLTMTSVRGLFHVELGRNLVPVQMRKGKKFLTYGIDIEPEVDESIQRVGGKGPGTGAPDVRFRPIYKQWTAEFEVTYNERLCSVQQLVGLLSLGGFHVGVCEHRACKGGQNGLFRVAQDMAEAAE
jgi:hypothetical protein